MSQHKYSIAKPEQVQKRIKELSKRSDEIQSRLAQSFKGLWDPTRTLDSVSELSVFASLYARFPNFSEVIEFYELHAQALHYENQPFEVPPVLLQGDPGLGKTYFVSELAKALNLGFYEISLATTTAGFALSGLSTQWHEGSPGFVANSLISSKTANPIILLDEIDKSGGNGNHSAIKPFFSLLESHSAMRFKDEALEVELDTSKIIWIATSNYLDCIPEPIQSRMRMFQIERPQPEDMEMIVSSIYQNIKSHRVYTKQLVNQLPTEIVAALVDCTPREIKQCLELAMIAACKDRRKHLEVSDLVIVKAKEKRNVGFL